MGKPVTILEVALARGIKSAEGSDGYSMGEFDRVGLPMLGGCQVCEACIAAYNACPSTTGYLRCASGCIGDKGFPSVKAFEAWSSYQDALSEAASDEDSNEGPYDDMPPDGGMYPGSG
jgi:hypothetical protein